jgi:hypothetical protein
MMTVNIYVNISFMQKMHKLQFKNKFYAKNAQTSIRKRILQCLTVTEWKIIIHLR